MSIEDLLDELKSERPAMLRLAEAVSLAVRVDPPLLRRARRTLVPEADAGTEADLWRSPLVQARGPEGFVFFQEAGEALRSRLARDEDGRRLTAAWELTKSLHEHLSPALLLEEEITYLSVSSDSGAAEEIEDSLRTALYSLVVQERRGLVNWAARAMASLPSAVLSLDTARMLNAGAHLRLNGDARAFESAEAFSDGLSWVVPADLPRTSIAVRLFEGSIEFDARPKLEGQRLFLPQTDPLLMELSWYDEIEDDRQTVQVTLKKGEVRRIAVPVQEVRLQSLLGEVYNLRRAGTGKAPDSPADPKGLPSVVQAVNPRRRERPSLPEIFDVFLSYNSKDRDAVRRVAVEMRRQGLRVWMDEKVLPLGQPWQPQVEEILKVVRSAAVFLGPAGFGDWQAEEVRLCLTQNIKRRILVIPVLLPGGPAPEALPAFLKEWVCSDLRDDPDGARLQRLIQEIRGKLRPPRGPKIHNLPLLPLGDLLKGRDEELRTLETNLHGPNAATAITQTHAIHGLGGIGKTRLAVEYAWRSGNRYDAALFVVAESPEALRSSLAKLAELDLPGLPHSPSRAQEEEVDAVLAWLREHNRWLLILDNVDTPEAAAAVEDLLPQLTTGHVLLTSRRREWSAGIQKQPLGALSSEEAVQFLLQRTDGERAKSPDDTNQAKRLAETLDGLPLALGQAAAYIAHHQISFQRYLEDWKTQRGAVLSYFDRNVMSYPASVAVTWLTTFNQLHPTAAAILRLAAYLGPDPIPLDMFEEGAAIVEEAVGLLLEETGQEAAPQTVRDGLGELTAYSMMVRVSDTGSVHQIVQEVVRSRISEERRRDWIQRSLRLVNAYAPFDADDVRTWGAWNLLRPHAEAVVRYADSARIAQPTSKLMNQLELHLIAKGLYAEAEPLIRRSLAIEEEIAPDSPEVATSLNNLASLLRDTNRLAEAEPVMRRALKIDEDSFGPDHPNAARDLNNLAQLLQATNRLSEAEPLMRRALKIDENSFGPDHPNAARDLNNLVQLLQATNRLAEAEPLTRRALKIDEDSFGPDHPNVARDLNNLARLLQATNRLAEAEPLMRRAVEIFEASLGPEHPSSQLARRNLTFFLTR